MSKSDKSASAKAARNSWRRLRTAVVSLSRSRFAQCEVDAEGCGEGGEEIFETQPLAVGSKYDALAMPI
jgi:hypothetical protein